MIILGISEGFIFYLDNYKLFIILIFLYRLDINKNIKIVEKKKQLFKVRETKLSHFWLNYMKNISLEQLHLQVYHFDTSL